MKIVICNNASNLPQGAHLEKDKEYEVEEEYINALDQRVYIIKGVPNSGITKLGMKWKGYSALRFSLIESWELVGEEGLSIEIENWN